MRWKFLTSAVFEKAWKKHCNKTVWLSPSFKKGKNWETEVEHLHDVFEQQIRTQ